MTDIKKNYYAIIPANVRYDEDLIPSAKLLYGEITALCNERGYCWASNDYFASLYSVSKTSIKKWLKSLEDGGYIHREVKYKEGRKEIDTRWITIVAHPRQEKLPTPRQEKGPDNNTVINTTVNNTNNNIMSSKLDDASASIPYKEIIEYLNDKADRKYKHTTGKTKTLIKARWNEGFELDDFKKVIDKKVATWLDNNMSKYLRPETLFGTKFEGYLNEKGRGDDHESEYDNYF